MASRGGRGQEAGGGGGSLRTPGRRRRRCLAGGGPARALGGPRACARGAPPSPDDARADGVRDGRGRAQMGPRLGPPPVGDAAEHGAGVAAGAAAAAGGRGGAVSGPAQGPLPAPEQLGPGPARRRQARQPLHGAQRHRRGRGPAGGQGRGLPSRPVGSQSGSAPSPGDETPGQAQEGPQALPARPEHGPRLGGRAHRVRHLLRGGGGHRPGGLPVHPGADPRALPREGARPPGPHAAAGGGDRPALLQHHRRQSEEDHVHPQGQLGAAEGHGGNVLPPHLPHGGHRGQHPQPLGDPPHPGDPLRGAGEEPGGAERGHRHARGHEVRQRDAGVPPGVRRHRRHPGDPQAGAGLRGSRGSRQVPDHTGPGGTPHPSPSPGCGEADAGVHAVAQLRGRHEPAPRGIRSLGPLQARLHPPFHRRQREDLAPAHEPHPDAGGLPAHHHPQGAEVRVLPRAGGGQRRRREAVHPLHCQMYRDHPGHPALRHNRVPSGTARGQTQSLRVQGHAACETLTLRISPWWQVSRGRGGKKSILSISRNLVSKAEENR